MADDALSGWRPDSAKAADGLRAAATLALVGKTAEADLAFADLINDFPDTVSDFDAFGVTYATCCMILEALVLADETLQPKGTQVTRAEYGRLGPDGEELAATSDAPEFLTLVAAIVPAYANGDKEGVFEACIAAGPEVVIPATHFLFHLWIKVLLSKWEADRP